MLVMGVFDEVVPQHSNCFRLKSPTAHLQGQQQQQYQQFGTSVGDMGTAWGVGGTSCSTDRGTYRHWIPPFVIVVEVRIRVVLGGTYCRKYVTPNPPCLTSTEEKAKVVYATNHYHVSRGENFMCKS